MSLIEKVYLRTRGQRPGKNISVIDVDIVPDGVILVGMVILLVLIMLICLANSVDIVILVYF